MADREQAFQELLIAEGSDWFWWYGDDHSSDHDLEFDDLFRRHLRNVYQMLGQPIPEELFVTNISTSQVPLSVVAARRAACIPVLDGESTSYFEWLPAGGVETDVPSGTMTGANASPSCAAAVWIRPRAALSAARPERACGPEAGQGLRCSINFTTPADRRLVVTGHRPRPAAELHEKRSDGAWAAADGATRGRCGRHSRGAAPVRRPRAAHRPAVRILRVDSPCRRSSWSAIRRTGRSRAACRNAAFEKLNWKA